MFNQNVIVQASNGGIAAGRDVNIQVYLGRLTTGYRSQIDDFVRSYIGTDTTPVPFGGREAQFQTLNEWFETGEKKCLLTAPAGHGKSALLVHWLFDQKSQDEIDIVFVPISTRFSTNHSAVFLEVLVQQLADILGEQLDAPENHREIYYIDKFKEYIPKADARNKPLLIVIDGLDEAVSFNNWDTMLPAGDFQNVKVLYSARITARKNTSGWLSALNWNRETVSIMEVPPLSEPEITQLTVDTLVGTIDNPSAFGGEVFRISQGNPLTCYFILSDVLNSNDPISKLNNLGGINSGFCAYFECWMDGLKLHENFDQQKIDFILLILATAFAPVTLSDLEILVSILNRSPEYISLKTLEPIDRMLIKTAKNNLISLNHPKFSDYILNEYFEGSGIIHDGQQAFFTYATDISQKKCEFSSYLLENYRFHLDEYDGDLSAADIILDKSWRKTQLASALRHSAYADDVETAWKVAERAYFEKNSIDEKEFCSFVIKCGLAQASISSLGEQTPTGILALAIEASLIPVEYALKRIDKSLKSNQLPQKVEIFRYLPEAVKNSVINEIKETATVSSKMGYYLSLVDHVGSEEKDAIEEICRNLLEDTTADPDLRTEMIRRYGKKYSDHEHEILRAGLIARFLDTFDNQGLATEAMAFIEYSLDPISKAESRIQFTLSAGGKLDKNLINKIIDDLGAETNQVRLGKCICDFLYRYVELRTEHFLNYADRLINDLLSHLDPQLAVDQIAQHDFCELFTGKLFTSIAKAKAEGSMQDTMAICKALSQIPAYYASTACIKVIEIADDALRQKLIDLAFQKCAEQPTANNRTFSYAELAKSLKGHDRYEEAVRLSFSAAEEINDFPIQKTWDLVVLQRSNTWPTNVDQWLSEVARFQDFERKCMLYISFLKVCDQQDKYERCKELLFAEVNRATLNKKVMYYSQLITVGIIKRKTDDYCNFLKIVREFFTSVAKAPSESGVFELCQLLPMLDEPDQDIIHFLLSIYRLRGIREYSRISGLIKLWLFADTSQKLLINKKLDQYFENAHKDQVLCSHALSLYKKTGMEEHKQRFLGFLPELSMLQAVRLYHNLLNFEGISVDKDTYKMLPILTKLPILEKEELASKILTIELSQDDHNNILDALFDLLDMYSDPEEQDQILREIIKFVRPGNNAEVLRAWNQLKKIDQLTLGEEKLVPLISDPMPVKIWNDLMREKSKKSRDKVLKYLGSECCGLSFMPDIDFIDKQVSDVIEVWP